MSFLSSQCCASLLFSTCLVCCLLPHSAMAKQNAGKTIIAKGTVQAFDSNSQSTRTLKRRSKIFDVDKIVTEQDSLTQLRMLDGAMISLAPNSELLISEYNLNQQDEKGSVVMELVKGGLRTVTGTIKGAKGDYELKTPVGSIGIRGTHYQVDLSDGNILMGVWDGNVKFAAPTGAEFLLGDDQDFAFAKVSPSGEVEMLTAPPAEFAAKFSAKAPAAKSSGSSSSQGSSESGSDSGSSGSDSDSDSGSSDTDTAANDSSSSDSGSSSSEGGSSSGSDDEFLSQDLLNSLGNSSDLAQLIDDATGIRSYGQNGPLQGSFNSTLGAASDFSISMSIDFDNGIVNEGQLSLTDSGGEWFAAFNGVINVDKFELGVNFASHGNELADGEINATFIDDLEKISGSFELFEINQPDVKVDGSFLID